jgi:hypothetical protein
VAGTLVRSGAAVVALSSPMFPIDQGMRAFSISGAPAPR